MLCLKIPRICPLALLIKVVLRWRWVWAVTAEARFWWRASPCDISCEQSGTGTGFSPSVSVFPCQYHVASTPYSPSS
jgi:hypothetical protein